MSVLRPKKVILLLEGLPRLGNLAVLHVERIQFPTDHSSDLVLV